MITIETFLRIAQGGLVLGALYALMASGLAVMWTTLGVFNFAHGVFIAVGAYTAWAVMQGGGLLVGAVASLALLFCLGVVFYFFLVRPFERKPNIVLASVITTLAGAIVLENLIQAIWGARQKKIDRIEQIMPGDLNLSGIRFPHSELALLAVTFVALILVGYFLQRTRLGRSMRAVAQNREAAELMGLDVPKLYALAFGLSAMLAALAGIFVGSIRFMAPTMGADPLLKALIVVIFGGVARFTSPILAAFIIGMVEAVSTYMIGLYWTPAVLFALMVIVLVLKPEGLFGTHQRTVQ